MRYLVNDTDLTSIADAIREKKGTSSPIAFDNFSAEISDIPEYSGEGVPVEEYDKVKNTLAGIIDRSISGEISGDWESIGSNAFRNCINLISADLSKATSVGDYAFDSCSKLESLELPNVTSVGSSAFRYCSNLKSVNMTLMEVVENGVFSGCKSLTYVNMPLLNEAKQSAFSGCEALPSLDGFPLLKKTGQYSFEYCNGLVEINLPSVEIIGQGAFRKCENLVKAVFPKSTNIITGAFEDNYNLTEVDLASAVSFSSFTFRKCRKLDTLILRKTESIVAYSNTNAFEETPFAGYNGLTGTVYVPQALIEEYKQATNWIALYEAGTCTFLPIEGSEYE